MVTRSLVGPSTSVHRSQDRPIESVDLKITFRVGRETAAKIKGAIPSAVLKNGSCEVRLKGSEPGEVADKAREILEKVRGIVEPSKGFK